MIVRNQPGQFILIQQHEHALLSGVIAKNWGGAEIPALPKPDAALILAARLHDIGWQKLDAAPLWNPARAQPYSFVDEPLKRKLPQYNDGIDRVLQEDAYAALLCSMHYASFFPNERLEEIGPEAAKFVQDEGARQERLSERLISMGRTDEWSRRHFDLTLLKLWDDLSLYLCLNEPGTSKKDEFPWYRDGFRRARFVNRRDADLVQLHARWLDDKRVAIHPFPFSEPLEIQLEFKRLLKDQIDELGYRHCYEEAPNLHQAIVFVPYGPS